MTEQEIEIWLEIFGIDTCYGLTGDDICYNPMAGCTYSCRDCFNRLLKRPSYFEKSNTDNECPWIFDNLSPLAIERYRRKHGTFKRGSIP